MTTPSARGPAPAGAPLVGVILGTRPEVVKLAPVVAALRASGRLLCRLYATGQHASLLEEALADFGLVPDADLRLMTAGQTLGALTARVVAAVERLLEQERPAAVLVQGDTTTVFASALAAFYRGVPVGHVEAGLRSGSLANPFPEEFNRRAASLLARWHFAPTARAAANLAKEGVPGERVFVTGNTVIDALLTVAATVDREDHAAAPELAGLAEHPRIVLVTAHRRESFGEPLERICRALDRVARLRPDAAVVYPVHPNPNVRGPVERLLAGGPVRLLPPLPYRRFVWLFKRARVALTDSGGMQEEAPSLRVPVLVLREVTERPEAVEAGGARMVGTNPDAIVGETLRLLDDETERRRMTSAPNPFGDGRAAERIAGHVESALLAARP